MSNLKKVPSGPDTKYLTVLADDNCESNLSYTPSQTSTHTYEEPIQRHDSEHSYVEPNPKIPPPPAPRAAYNRPERGYEATTGLGGSVTMTTGAKKKKTVKVNSRLILIAAAVVLVIAILTAVITYVIVKHTREICPVSDCKTDLKNMKKEAGYVVMFTQNYKASVSELIITSKINEVSIHSVTGTQSTLVPSVTILRQSLGNVTTGNDIIKSKGVIVNTSKAAVSVYGISTYKDDVEHCCSSDGFAAIPVQNWGMEYKIITLMENIFQKQIGVVSIYDNTVITFELNTTTKQGPITITLNKQETYQLSRTTDLTGSKVRGTKHFGVFSGDQCGYHNGSGCSYMVENIPKLSDWGNTYVIPMFKNISSVFVKLLPAKDNAFITVVNRRTRVFQTNGYLQLDLDASGPTFINGDSPFLLAAYASFDNQFYFMTLIPSICQFSNNFILGTPSVKQFEHFVSVVIQDQYANELMLGKVLVNSLNLEVNKLQIENKTWRSISFQLPEGVHYLRHPDQKVRFGVIQYGVGSQYGHDNYGYPAGLEFNSDKRNCNI